MDSDAQHRSFGVVEDSVLETTAMAADEASHVENQNSTVRDRGGDHSGQINESYLEALRGEIIGSFELFDTPYGRKPCVYADWTASGRALQQVRDILPLICILKNGYIQMLY